MHHKRHDQSPQIKQQPLFHLANALHKLLSAMHVSIWYSNILLFGNISCFLPYLAMYLFYVRPAPRHYYPTLLHIMAELEDARAVPTKQGSVSGQDVLSPDVSSESNGTPARFGFDENVFPGYSWKGYATMSDLQVGEFSQEQLPDN